MNSSVWYQGAGRQRVLSFTLLMTFASKMKSGVLSLFPHVQECKVILAVYITIMWLTYMLCGLCLMHHLWSPHLSYKDAYSQFTRNFWKGNLASTFTMKPKSQSVTPAMNCSQHLPITEESKHLIHTMRPKLESILHKCMGVSLRKSTCSAEHAALVCTWLASEYDWA